MAVLVQTRAYHGMKRQTCERCLRRRATVELMEVATSLGKFCGRCGAVELARHERNPLKLPREEARQ